MAWGIALKGHQFDLLDWADAFQKPFEPWVERVERAEPLYVLRSSEFELAKTSGDVWDRAEALIARLNGAMLLACGSSPLSPDGVVDIASDGSLREHVRISVGTAVIRSRARMAAIALDKDGQKIPQEPTPSEAQRLNLLSALPSRGVSQADDISDLLVHLARSDNWIDLYKAIELVTQLAGKEHKMLKNYGEDGRLLKRAKSSANVHRHARFVFQDPMTLVEARSVLLRMAKNVLATL